MRRITSWREDAKKRRGQLQAVIGEIATYEEKLKELRRRKKEIEQKITEDKKEALYRAVMESGKSLDEVLAGLSNQ